MHKRTTLTHPPEKMPLKAFWEAMEQRLAARSADELRSILRGLAQSTPSAERRVFLDKLKPAKVTAAAVQKKLKQDELLDDIDDLAQEIQEATEDADAWTEDDGYWDGYYDDEDSLGPYEAFVDQIVSLLRRTQAVFDHGNFPLARQAYQKLFEEALKVEDDYGRGVRAEDLAGVDVGENRARYLRAVYETEKPASRPRTLLRQMRQTQAWLSAPPPMLSDLIEISPALLPDRERFLANWIALLRKEKDKAADSWLLEAVRLSQGTAGLAELAQREGVKRPRAFLDWFTALEAEGRHQAVLAAAQTALTTLPAKLPIRAAIADHLCAAAVRLNEAEALRAGRWEAFAAAPTLSRLLDVWEAVPESETRAHLMQQAARHIEAYLARPPRWTPTFDSWEEDQLETPVWTDRSVLAHACVLAGDFDGAYQMALREKALGWSGSNNSQGFVAPLCLVVLSGKALNALPPNLKQLWRRALETSLALDEWIEDGATAGAGRKRLERIYVDQLPRLALSQDRQETLLAWCLSVSQKRVKAIVGEQHRRSYDKAARLLAACAEVLRLRGRPEAAKAILDEVRQQFPRHRAFLAELDAVAGRARRSR